jgi:4-amino-4-deoxy-L-arabinose transferase-like glycosyltransferase
MQQFLHQLNMEFFYTIPFFVLANLVLLLFFIFYNFRHFKFFLLSIKKQTWLILLGFFLFAIILRLSIIPFHHEIYVDEQGYMETAKNLLVSGDQGIYSKSIGWPFMIAIFFKIFGINNFVALYSSFAFSVLSIIAIFLLTQILFKRESVSLLSALILSIIPNHVIWSASAETNIVSLFFILLTLFFWLFYYEKGSFPLLWLSALTFSFTSQIRPENFILLPLFFLGLYAYHGKKIFNICNDYRFTFPCLTAIFISLPNLFNVAYFYSSTNWMQSDSLGKISGNNWGLSNLFYNTINFFPEIINTNSIVISLLFVFGIFFLFYKKDKRGWFLLSCFCFFWFAYFSSWMQTLGGRSRFYINFSPVIIIGASYGVWLIWSKFKRMTEKPKPLFFCLILMIVMSVSFFPMLSTQKKIGANPYKILETKIPELIKKDIPSNCSIIASEPVIINSTTNFNSFSLDDFLSNKNTSIAIKQDCLLFFEDMYCLDNSIRFKNQCQEIKKRYELEPFKTFSDNKINYTFYSIKGKI